MVRQQVRRVVKSTAANVLHYSGLRRAMAAYRRAQSGGRRILIVSYHRVVEDFTGEVQRSIPGLLISTETFRRHLEEARGAGYEFATLDHALDVMAGRRTAKRDLCVVTFDDGYRDVCRHAHPVLRELGVPAMLYLPADIIGTRGRFNHDRLFHLLLAMRRTGARPLYDGLPAEAAELLAPIFSGAKTVSQSLDDFIGEHRTATLTALIDALEAQLGGGPELVPEQGDPMDWDEVRKLGDCFDFGAHTLGHCVLTLEDTATVDREIRESKAAIERETGRRVEHFAYCNGWYSDEVIRSLGRAGFRSGVTTEDYPNVIGGDPFTLKRKVLWENFSLGMTGGYSASLTGCHLDDVFGVLGASRPVPGRRPQRLATPIGDPFTLRPLREV